MSKQDLKTSDLSAALMIGRGLQKALGVETTEALRGELFAEAAQGRSGGFVDGLLRDAQPLADLGVTVSLSDEGEDLLSPYRQ